MNTIYQTLIVKFSEPITALDGIFDDAQAWGTLYNADIFVEIDAIKIIDNNEYQ